MSKLGAIKADVTVQAQALCASCTRNVDMHVRRAIGRNNAVVSICAECDGGDLRSGRWSFGEKAPMRMQARGAGRRAP